MTHKVTKPIALDESFRTTSLNPQNIADVLAGKLDAIKEAIENDGGDIDAAFVCYYNITTATQIYNAMESGKVPYFYNNGIVAQLWKVETNKYTFRTTSTRVVEGENILDIVDYIVNGSVWSTATKTISGGSSSQQSYLAKVESSVNFDTTGLSGMQSIISVNDVPADGIYQLSIFMCIIPKTASATKSDLVFQFTGTSGTGMPNTTFHAVVDDSQTFGQQLSFSTTLNLKAGTNTLKMACGGLNTEYLVFVDDLTVAQLVNGVYHNGDNFDEVHTLPEAADFSNDDGVLVDGATGGPRFMLWRTLANKVLGFIKSLSTTITAFRSGDVILVDGPDGPAKMAKDSLLAITAEYQRSDDKAFVYSELPAENFGTWELGSFSSSLTDVVSYTRSRTSNTFLASKDLVYTFHIPDGYKLYIAWTTSTAEDRQWRTGTSRARIPKGDYYRIAIARTDDSDVQGAATTLYASSGTFVDEDYYSVKNTEERIDEKVSENHSIILDKAFVYSGIPTENFGVWESGSFSSSFEDIAINSRARTKETFLAEKDLVYTFHIPNGYKLYINWTSANADDRQWRTGTSRVHIPAGDYYRIAVAKTDDSNVTSIASTIYEKSRIFVDEDYYSAQRIRENVYCESPFKGLMGANCKWTSRHFVCLTDGFDIEDKFSRAYLVKRESGSARCKVAILGKPSNNFKMSFKVGNPTSFGWDADATHEIHFMDVNDNEHILKNRKPDDSYSRTWYLDGTDTGGCWFMPIELSYDGNNFKVVVDSGEPLTIYTGATNVKDIHFEAVMSKGSDVFIEDYSQSGYTLKVPTSTMPFPFIEGISIFGNVMYCGYWNYENKLELYSRDLLTGEEHFKTFNDISLSEDDTHNYVAIGVDLNGGIHVACDCHVSPIVYLYGDDFDSVAVSNKLSNSSATYPSFFVFNNNFYATYRELTTANGRWKVYRYDHALKTFSATTDDYIARGDIISPSACPYLQKWVIDEKNGWCYNSFCWRDSGENWTNHDFFAFKTQDFETFYNLNDEELTLPIDQSNCTECQLDYISVNSHLLNQQTNVVILDGVPIALNFHDDLDGYTNLYAYKYADGKLVKRKISQIYGAGFYPVFLQANVCEGIAKVVVYTNHGLDRQNGNRTINIYFDKNLNWWTDRDVDDCFESVAGKIRYLYNGKIKGIAENYSYLSLRPYSTNNCGFLIFD